VRKKKKKMPESLTLALFCFLFFLSRVFPFAGGTRDAAKRVGTGVRAPYTACLAHMYSSRHRINVDINSQKGHHPASPCVSLLPFFLPYAEVVCCAVSMCGTQHICSTPEHTTASIALGMLVPHHHLPAAHVSHPVSWYHFFILFLFIFPSLR
jgi:hypothetical protein